MSYGCDSPRIRSGSYITRSVFERYNIVSEGDLRGAAERLTRAYEEMDERAQKNLSGRKKGTIGLVK